MRSPLFRELLSHICINCITQSKDTTQNKWPKVLIQHTQLPCGEEESQKHEAHLYRKYWKRKKLKLDLEHRSKAHFSLCNCCVCTSCPVLQVRIQAGPHLERSNNRQPLKTENSTSPCTEESQSGCTSSSESSISGHNKWQGHSLLQAAHLLVPVLLMRLET